MSKNTIQIPRLCTNAQLVIQPNLGKIKNAK